MNAPATTKMMTQMMTAPKSLEAQLVEHTSTESRALQLLGSGVKPEIVAASLGMSPSAISQLLSDENFAAAVAELRYENLAKHNERDSHYDTMESKLLGMLDDCLPLMHKPFEILKAIQVINAAKRRGASTPEALIEKQQIIQLVVPVTLINKFQTDVNGQVTNVGEQDLLTIQSGALDGFVKARRNENGGSNDVARIASSKQDR